MLANTDPEACLASAPVSNRTSCGPYWNVFSTRFTANSSALPALRGYFRRPSLVIKVRYRSTSIFLR